MQEAKSRTTRGDAQMTYSPMSDPGLRSVLLLGATGLVGSECLRLLSEDETVGRIVVLTRRRVAALPGAAKVEQHVVDFDHLTAHAGLFAVDQIFCALGTTTRQTPSKDRYRAVDFLYPITAAHLGVEKGASHYLLVSALGANARSPLFYNRLKGELEGAVKALSYRSVTIVQPSVLIGERDEPRMSERIAWKLSFLTPRKYKPVRGSSVAQALVRSARANERGVRVIANRDIEATALA